MGQGILKVSPHGWRVDGEGLGVPFQVIGVKRVMMDNRIFGDIGLEIPLVGAVVGKLRPATETALIKWTRWYILVTQP